MSNFVKTTTLGLSLLAFALVAYPLHSSGAQTGTIVVAQSSDALTLDPSDGRVALNLVLAKIAQGDWAGARSTLQTQGTTIPASDRGLAFALAGDPVTAIRTKAPGNDQSFGGVKVETGQGWFAARPSGTEDVYKIYAESFRGEDHLKLIQQDARAAIAKAF